MVSLLMPYIFSAMADSAIDIRLMAFKFFHLVVQYYPPTFSLYAEKVSTLISWMFTFPSFACSISFHTFILARRSLKSPSATSCRFSKTTRILFRRTNFMCKIKAS